MLSPKCSYLQRISIPADFKIPSAIRSQAYRFGETGIHWSMTAVASVVPFCLELDLRGCFPVALLAKCLSKGVFLDSGEYGLADVLS